MLVVFAIILLMLGVGFFTRKYDGRVRFLLFFGIGLVVLYATVKL